MTVPQQRAADAVVIGAGIVGVCVGLYLQRTGRQVVLVDRAAPGEGASGHNGGVLAVGECVPTGTPDVIRSLPSLLRAPLSPLAIRYAHLHRLAPWMVRFALASRANRVEPIAAALQSLTARSYGAYEPLLDAGGAAGYVHEGGVLYAYQGDAAFAAASFAQELRTRRHVKFEILDARGVDDLDPALAGRFHRGIHFPEWRFTTDVAALVRALAESFAAAGGTVVHDEVLDVERGQRRVQAVTTTGGRIATDAVVIAAGAWSRRFARDLGVDVPLEAERGYGVDLPDPGFTLQIPITVPDFHISMGANAGGMRILGVDELATVAAPPDFRLVDRIVRAARRVFPELRVEGATSWMRCRPSMPDSLPVIGRTPRYENAYLAFGHGHKGLGLGAITGKLIQELVDDTTTSVDLTAFRPTRFALRPSRRAIGTGEGGRS
jgi:D-amino-acid dehydrogenase